MKVFAIGLIPLVACCLSAQTSQTRTEDTTTTTASSFGGTLVDEGCHNTRTEHHESSKSDNPAEGSHTSTRSDSTTTTSDCPVTMESRSFGLVTADGQYIHLDPTSNEKVIEIIKGNKAKFVDSGKPVRVEIKGKKKGDYVVVDSIQ